MLVICFMPKYALTASKPNKSFILRDRENWSVNAARNARGLFALRKKVRCLGAFIITAVEALKTQRKTSN